MDDKRYPEENIPNSLMIAEVSTIKDLSQTDFDNIKKDLDEVCQAHGLKLTVTNYFSHRALLTEVTKSIQQFQSDFKWDSRDNDKKQISDAFFQLETGNKLKVNEDGSYHGNDLRHPQNQFGDFDLEQLYGYCLDLSIVTQYTPIEFLSTQYFVDILTWRYLTGNPKQRDLALNILNRLSAEETKGKRFEEIDIVENQLHLFIASRRLQSLNE
ncbi:hypothetical protein [uncultured Sneathiella sp.]|uniref:hypothetical protein n=1 Tax=uncultured Sneathiella sp. TaxID=879315 RepID=UPI0030D6E4DE